MPFISTVRRFCDVNLAHIALSCPLHPLLFIGQRYGPPPWAPRVLPDFFLSYAEVFFSPTICPPTRLSSEPPFVGLQMFFTSPTIGHYRHFNMSLLLDDHPRVGPPMSCGFFASNILLCGTAPVIFYFDLSKPLVTHHISLKNSDPPSGSPTRRSAAYVKNRIHEYTPRDGTFL